MKDNIPRYTDARQNICTNTLRYFRNSPCGLRQTKPGSKESYQLTRITYRELQSENPWKVHFWKILLTPWIATEATSPGDLSRSYSRQLNLSFCDPKCRIQFERETMDLKLDLFSPDRVRSGLPWEESSGATHLSGKTYTEQMRSSRLSGAVGL